MNDENCKAEASSADAAAAAAASPASIAAAVSSNAVAAPSGASAPPPPSLPHSVASYPTVSFHSLQRAQKTIADFMQSYLFIFHAQPDRCDSGRTGGSGATDSAVAGAAATSAAHCSSQSADLGLPSSSGVPSAATLQLMFRLLPLLTFVSATIYQLDEENEEHNQRQRCKREQEREEGANADTAGAETAVAAPSAPRNPGKRSADAGSSDRAHSRNSKRSRLDADSREPASSSSSDSSSDSEDESSSEASIDDSDGDGDGVAAASSPSYGVLLAVLRSQGLLTERVHAELRKGLLYWQLERQICAQLHDIAEYRERHDTADQPLSSAPAPSPPPPPSLSLTDVHTASSCKSFDYRVLHLLCYGSTGQAVNDSVLRALALNERLVDLHDDLVDYEDDVIANSFNLYRCYVAHYGPARAPAMVAARIQRLEEEFAAKMALLPRHLQDAFRAREARAMAEDSARSSSGSGNNDAACAPAASLKQDGSTWTIPPPIANESAWRREVLQAESLSRALEVRVP